MNQKNKAQVLVIEPNWAACQHVVQALHHLGSTAIVDSDMTDSQHNSADLQIDLVMLGMGHDRSVNLERLRRARRNYSGATIAGLCPSIHPQDRCHLLDSGLDFIVETPISVDECEATVRALLRRRHITQESSLAEGQFCKN
jgi:DNA-binding response OmpR family regulator